MQRIDAAYVGTRMLRLELRAKGKDNQRKEEVYIYYKGGHIRAVGVLLVHGEMPCRITTRSTDRPGKIHQIQHQRLFQQEYLDSEMFFFL